MKALMANKFFFRNGGSETVFFQEREFLLENGHDVVDFAMDGERNLPSAYEGHFVANRSYSGGGKLAKVKDAVSFIHSSEAVSKIGRLIDETKPDLVHCHNIYHQLTPSIIGAAKKRNVPVVLTLHDYKPVCPTYNRLRADATPCSDCLDGDFSRVVKNRCAEGSLGKSVLMYAEAVVQRAMGNYEQVDAFVAPSRFMQDSIARRIPRERVRLLYNGIDPTAIAPHYDDDGYVLYLGRLVREKGVETLLRAHAAAKGAWRVVIAGTGPLGDALKVKYDPKVFVGHLSGEALQDTIRRAAAVVVPSEWYENCPMSVIEAMAYGKPVIGSRMGGIPELVDEGKTGFLFEAGNAEQLTTAVEHLMAQPALRRQMGEAARLRVEREFTLERHNAGLMDIYQSVLGE
ncbi:MAG: glycosyltransferase family 4 protein [Burkholderiaceae bacterium]|nr:glycosyltransferase family 4 protein [Burkholderiaceae bacterium]